MNTQRSLSLVPSFADLELRLHDKFDIRRSDAQLAVKYLRCFFDAKVRNPTGRIILPQIADWAWHELILDTYRYRQFCLSFFGKLLSHVADDIDNPARNNRMEFIKSMEFMQNNYALDLGEDPETWMEAGWGKPLYRLRSPINEITGSMSCWVGSRNSEFSELYEGILSWLPCRLVQRFGISEYSAQLGVLEHIDQLSIIGAGGHVRKRSVIGQIAWEEHILWIDRYSEDCKHLLGYFLDHTPNPILPYQRKINLSIAAHA